LLQLASGIEDAEYTDYTEERGHDLYFSAFFRVIRVFRVLYSFKLLTAILKAEGTALQDLSNDE
jgi:hypothetical protein